VQADVWVLSGATGAAVVVLAVTRLVTHGQSQFFATGDPRMFLLTARDLFGTGHGFAALGRASEIPYRYGRMGLPLLAWILALGRPALVGWTLIAVNLVALAAIPGLAALLLDDDGAPPRAAGFIFVLPAFAVLFGNVFSDPLAIALLLIAYLLDQRAHRRSALVLLAYAVLVKEIAVLALIPLLLRAVRGRVWRDAGAVAATVLPYAGWCCWVRWRVGAFPFLANTEARRGALGLPFVAFVRTLERGGGDNLMLLAIVTVTIALGIAGAGLARRNPLGTLAAAYAVVSICMGRSALDYAGEGLRVLLIPQVFAILALGIGLRARRAPDNAGEDSDAREPVSV
jgi:hypothetical protein